MSEVMDEYDRVVSKGRALREEALRTPADQTPAVTPLTTERLAELDQYAVTFARRARIGLKPAEIRILVAMARRAQQAEHDLQAAREDVASLREALVRYADGRRAWMEQYDTTRQRAEKAEEALASSERRVGELLEIIEDLLSEACESAVTCPTNLHSEARAALARAGDGEGGGKTYRATR